MGVNKLGLWTLLSRCKRLESIVLHEVLNFLFYFHFNFLFYFFSLFHYFDLQI